VRVVCSSSCPGDWSILHTAARASTGDPGQAPDKGLLNDSLKAGKADDGIGDEPDCGTSECAGDAEFD
jgi:hypothetical protein